MEALILVATLGGPTTFARIGIMGRPEAEGAHRMKLTRRFAALTAEKRPQDPRMDGTGLRFETMEHGGESRLRKSEQGDKWNFCLTAGKIGSGIRGDDEQRSTPEPHAVVRVDGGACRRQGRPNPG